MFYNLCEQIVCSLLSSQPKQSKNCKCSSHLKSCGKFSTTAPTKVLSLPSLYSQTALWICPSLVLNILHWNTINFKLKLLWVSLIVFIEIAVQYFDVSEFLDRCERLDIHEKRYDHNPISSIQFWNATISIPRLRSYFHRDTVACVRIRCLKFKKSSRDRIFRSHYDFYWSQSETRTIEPFKYMLHALEISSNVSDH